MLVEVKHHVFPNTLKNSQYIKINRTINIKIRKSNKPRKTKEFIKKRSTLSAFFYLHNEHFLNIEGFKR